MDQLVDGSGKEENEWFHIRSWWGDEEEPERQAHELFSKRGKCRELSFPLTGIRAPWGQRPQGYLIPGIVPST